MKTDRVAALETKIKNLEKQVRTLQDIEEIQRLQKAYGYYIEHWMAKEIIDLFSDSPDASLTLAAGTYLGKKSIKRYFNHIKPTPEFIHQVMQLSGIVDVDPNGKTANGRWYGYGAVSFARDKGATQFFMGGIYVATYIKEKGIWKFLKLQFDQIYNATPATGWVKPEKVIRLAPSQASPTFPADIPRTTIARYPSGRIVPFHYKHPVTGKKTSEEVLNSSLEKKKSTNK